MKKILVSIFLLISLFFSVSVAVANDHPTPKPSRATIPREKKMGLKTSKEIEKQIPRVLDPDKEAKLAGIANKLIPFLTRNLDYEVRIIEMKEPNAFSLPGGITYITSGMLAFLKSEDEIAAVLSHEFIHADRAHVLVQMKRDNKLNLITLVGIIAATQGAGAPAILMSGAFQTAISNRYSIDLEKEADSKGIDVMYKAGYNPTAMLTMQERLKAEALKRAYMDPGIYQTHPEHDERIEAALKYMKDNGIEVQRRDVLNKLLVSVKREGFNTGLYIDRHVLLSLPNNEINNRELESFAAKLDANIELELAPYDIQVNKAGEDKTLLIKGQIILRDSERTPDMPQLEEIRNNLTKVLSDIRLETPLTNYFQ